MYNSIKDQLESMIDQVTIRRLRKFAGIHQGESCYIFGDGPSIKWFDLSQFNKYPAICSGLLPLHLDFNRLDVKYCLMIEPWLFAPKFIQNNNIHNIMYKSITSEYKLFIRERLDINFFVHLSNLLSISGRNVDYIFRGVPSKERSDALSMHFNLFGGSFHASLTLAYFLGFTKIYLVGFDAWTIQPARTLHWYELGNVVFFKPTNFATEFLEAIKTQAEIYTISAEGESRNVINISYKDHTGKSPRFRENHELISEHHLKVLATFPSYNIFPQ